MKQWYVMCLIFMTTINIAYGARVYSLYTDHKAVQEGDILTVLIVENAEAGSTTSTQTESTTRFGVKNNVGTGSLGFVPGFGAGGELGSGYDGGGSTRREGNLVAKVTARIDQVLSNGNLVISGNKVVEINDEKEIITLSGMVRPEDIESNNTIYSFNIADAQITYSGKGVNSDARRPGPIARFFNWLF